jgi:hypothetical protein
MMLHRFCFADRSRSSLSVHDHTIDIKREIPIDMAFSLKHRWIGWILMDVLTLRRDSDWSCAVPKQNYRSLCDPALTVMTTIHPWASLYKSRISNDTDDLIHLHRPLIPSTWLRPGYDRSECEMPVRAKWLAPKTLFCSNSEVGLICICFILNQMLWALFSNWQRLTEILGASILMSPPDSALVCQDNHTMLAGKEQCHDVTGYRRRYA